MKMRPVVFLFTLGAALLNAAPKLRLTQTAVGPIIVAQGLNGPAIAQTPYAYNAGDGALNLTVTSSETWLAPTLGPPTFCQNGPGCIPIRIGLPTSSLARGSYSGFITLSDPNALDSQQTISVIVLIGGGVPDQLTLYSSPNGTASRTFYTSNDAITRTSTQSGGAWLSVAAANLGSFKPSTADTVTVNAGSLAAGDYNGNIGVSNSQITAENKTIAVALHLTTQPIAQATATNVQFTIAQGAAKQVSYVVLGNAGQGTLTLAGAAVSTSSGGNWLTAQTSANNLIILTADPAGLSPGTYQATLTASSNAANGTVSIPVQLTLLAISPPYVSYQGVVNVFTNSAEDGLAQGGVAAVYGNQFTTEEAQVGNLPLGTSLAGTQVLINGQAIPVQYVSAGQINIQIPYDAPAGDATLRVARGGTQGNPVSIHIDPIAPVILPFPALVGPTSFTTGGTYVLAQTGSGGFEGYSSAAPAHTGDTVVFYAVGLGAASPSLVAGTAAPGPPNLAVVSPVSRVCFGALSPIDPFSRCTNPRFVGLTPGFFGLYQINFEVPANAPKGDSVQISVVVGNVQSNVLYFAIK